MKKIVLQFALLSSLMLTAADVQVNPDRAVIEVSPQCSAVAEFAAKDLQDHLKLITGKEIPIVPKAEEGKYVFRFVKTPGLKPEEARWEVREDGTTFTGDDENIPAGKKFALIMKSRTGSISAVADFLERQLNVRWLEPGEDGIFYVSSPVLELHTGSNTWDPGRLVMRGIRTDYPAVSGKGKTNDRIPQGLRLDPETYQKKAAASLLWFKHQRMGQSVTIPLGHSFTRWWALYGKEHPEYFALFKGKRQPSGAPDRIKMCVSNPALHQKIVDLWLKSDPRPHYINICENDSGGFCECEECRKWDVTPPGEDWQKHLSDRYFHFANAVLELARKSDPNVEVTFYAYSCYKEPPVNVTVSPGVVIGFVPSMFMLPEIEEMYKGWRAKGADKLILRPNDMHADPGLPIGMEKQIWEGFQLGVRNGIIGTDYDMCHGFWPTTGVANYILARAHSYPQASFEELFKHYCEGFGNAAAEIAEYYTYWRTQVWENRLIPNRKKIAEKGRYGNFRRGLMWDLPQYFKKEDFEATGKILERAMSKAESTAEKKRVAALLLGHQHAFLTYQAICAKGEKKIELSRKLLKFRIENRDKLNINLTRQCRLELEFGDLTGIGKAIQLAEFQSYKSLPLAWKFRIDPENVGKTEEWEKSSWADISRTWSPIYIDRIWENQNRPNVPEELRKKLKNYDGYGWYAQRLKIPARWKGKKIYLHFTAVNESARLWLNGQFCGERISRDKDDWKKPFALEITHQIDWGKEGQIAVIQVHDASGGGGINRPIMLAMKPEPVAVVLLRRIYPAVHLLSDKAVFPGIPPQSVQTFEVASRIFGGVLSSFCAKEFPQSPEHSPEKGSACPGTSETPSPEKDKEQ